MSVREVNIPDMVGLRKPENPQSKVQEILQSKVAMAALRFEVAEMDRMAAESEKDAADIKLGKPPSQEQDNAKVINLATNLLNAGVDPKIVGQLLSGVPAGVPMMTPQNNGLTVKDMMDMVKFIVERSPQLDLTPIVQRMEKLEESIKAPKPILEIKTVDPAEQVKQSVSTVKGLFDAFKDLGLVSAPSGNSSLEEKKEEHRHQENMARLKMEEEHKRDMTSLAANIPRQIGRGLAGAIRGDESGDSPGMSSFTCSGCGKKVFIPDDTVETVTCGHCGANYARNEK